MSNHMIAQIVVPGRAVDEATSLREQIAWTLAKEHWPLATEKERCAWADKYWKRHLSQADALIPIIEASRTRMES